MPLSLILKQNLSTMAVQLTQSSCLYEGESNENLKYVLSHNLLNTEGTQWLHFSIWYRTATCQTLFKPWASLLKLTRQSSCGSNFYHTFKVFSWHYLVYEFYQMGRNYVYEKTVRLAVIMLITCRWTCPICKTVIKKKLVRAGKLSTLEYFSGSDKMASTNQKLTNMKRKNKKLWNRVLKIKWL